MFVSKCNISRGWQSRHEAAARKKMAFKRHVKPCAFPDNDAQRRLALYEKVYGTTAKQDEQSYEQWIERRNNFIETLEETVRTTKMSVEQAKRLLAQWEAVRHEPSIIENDAMYDSFNI